MSRARRWRVGWAWRAAAVGPLGAARRTAALGLRDTSALVLSLPIRLLFKLVFASLRAIGRIRKALSASASADGAQASGTPPATA